MKNNLYIQARLNSQRLPGKVLKKICDKSIIELITERVSNIKKIDDIILVTGSEDKNKLILDEAEKIGISYFCGSEENVLDRFYEASQVFDSTNIIRITADCPLIDFNIVNKAISIFEENNYDILSNNRIRTFPHGLNFEIFTKKALQKSWEQALNFYENKEKFLKTFIPPTLNMLENEDFKNFDLINDEDLSNIRLTLDYQEDFELIKKIYEFFYFKNEKFDLKDILEFLNKNPELLKINKKYIAN